MTSLFDPWAKSKRQRGRLQGLFETPSVNPPEEEDDALSLFGGGPDNSAGRTDAEAGRGIEGNVRDMVMGLISPMGHIVGQDIKARSMSGQKMDPLSGMIANVAGWGAVGPQVPAFGMRDAVADEIGGAAVGGGIGGQTSGGFSGSGVEADRGFLAKGGIATEGSLFGPDPEGPDDGYTAFMIGERAINPDQWKMLKPETRADISQVFKKTGAKGVKK